MTPQDRQLVQLITEQVLAVLREQGMGTSAGGASPVSQQRADVRPPIGTCTGDYSKFPELAGRLNSAAPHVPPPAHQVNAPVSQPVAVEAVALSGVVTASRLQEAIDASPDGVALLAIDARISPLANDFVRQYPEKIRRVGSSAAATGGSVMPLADLPWYAWVQGQCSVAAEIINDRSERMAGPGAGQSSISLTQVARDLAGAISGGRVAGGVIFVPSAAKAMCYLNRCGSVRAIVGTCGEAVEQGVSEIGANVLVVEYPHHGPRAMTAMVDRMMQQPPKSPAVVQRDLADLHRCQ